MTEPQYPIPSREEEELEQTLGALFQEEESHKDPLGAPGHDGGGAITNPPEVEARLIAKGLVTQSGSQLVFTEAGRRVGRDVTRRHRLAERLLTDVLAISDSAINPNACKLEHILSPEVTESICTLLGHPRQCPHGLHIPEGACCKNQGTQVQPIIASLDTIPVGSDVKVAYVAMLNHPDIHRLLALGLVPGCSLRLHQSFPSFVIELGETTLAIENEIAARIFVRS